MPDRGEDNVLRWESEPLPVKLILVAQELPAPIRPDRPEAAVLLYGVGHGVGAVLPTYMSAVICHPGLDDALCPHPAHSRVNAMCTAANRQLLEQNIAGAPNTLVTGRTPTHSGDVLPALEVLRASQATASQRAERSTLSARCAISRLH